MSVASIVWERLEGGESAAEVAAEMGITANSVYKSYAAWRKVLGLPPRAKGRPHGTLNRCSRWEAQTPAEASTRVDREVAEGKRCNHPGRRYPCSLLLPCADHGGEP